MRVLHICLANFYIDNYSYQENMLPKFHKQLGYDVEIIASTFSFDKNGKGCYIKPNCYTSEYGIKVLRVDYKGRILKRLNRFIRRYNNFMYEVNNFNPDIIFMHGCQFYDIRKIAKYAKQHNIIVFVDNHADFSNSARNWISKNILHKIIWRRCAHIIEPYVKKFYGVLPARVEFLNKIYGIPKEKIELLVMGADDELVEKYRNKTEVRNQLKDIGLVENDFVIVTGGKIDFAKTQILTLMQVINEINKNVKLIIYGSVIEELQEEFNSLLSDKVKYVGWINSKDTYKYIAIADLLIYPGRHSVLWEQSVAQGKPMVVKYWQGTTHIDIGGNIIFLRSDNKDELRDIVTDIINNKDNIYSRMLKSASSEKSKMFLYSEIAKKSLSET